MIFTTAFYDIGRSSWGEIARSCDKYIEHFNNMIDDGFEYPLIVYTHPNVIAKMVSTRSYASNIFFADISSVKTFVCEPYLSNETDIMNSSSYKAKIPGFRIGAHEHTYPKYTLLTHSKICFLHHTRTLFPNCTYYAWIDFGYPTKTNICGWPVCPYPAVPKSVNMSLLEKKVHIGSTKIMPHYVSEDEFLAHNWFAFSAFSFIVHTEIFDDFYAAYVQKLEKWQFIGHADDEQNLMYQLYQDNKYMFKVFKFSISPWGLYKENLNGDVNSSILVL